MKEKLDSYDPSLVGYYETTAVSFSDGDVVSFSSEPVTVLDKLTKRIYKTRNSIVHSKENEKSRYIPFQHDKLLVKEVPLLRFIAEDIVLKTSTLIGM